MIWKMAMEAISRSNALAVNGEPVWRDQTQVLTFLPWRRRSSQEVSRGQPKRWPARGIRCPAGKAGRTHQRGNGREKYRNIEVLEGYRATWRSRNEGYREGQEKKQPLRVFELCLQVKTGSCPNGNVREQSLSPRHAEENGSTNRKRHFCYSAFAWQEDFFPPALEITNLQETFQAELGARLLKNHSQDSSGRLSRDGNLA